MRRITWTADEDAVLKKLYIEGIPAKEIAKRLGRSVYSVYQRKKLITEKEWENGHYDNI